MLRKALLNTTQSARTRRRHLEVRTCTSTSLPFPCSSNLTVPFRDDDDDDSKPLQPPIVSRNNQYRLHTTTPSQQQIKRQYTTTPAPQRGAAIALTLASVAAAAKAGQYVIQGYNEWKTESEKAARMKEEEEKKRREELMAMGVDVETDEARLKEEEEANAKAQEEEERVKQQDAGTKKKEEGKRENFFAKFFNLSVGSKFYEGGFEEQMTRKEAALILGVRESSTPKRIKEAHRKLLILNHPDTGGSTYMAGKINEAKELLLQGKKM